MHYPSCIMSAWLVIIHHCSLWPHWPCVHSGHIGHVFTLAKLAMCLLWPHWPCTHSGHTGHVHVFTPATVSRYVHSDHWSAAATVDQTVLVCLSDCGQFWSASVTVDHMFWSASVTVDQQFWSVSVTVDQQFWSASVTVDHTVLVCLSNCGQFWSASVTVDQQFWSTSVTVDSSGLPQ